MTKDGRSDIGYKSQVEKENCWHCYVLVKDWFITDWLKSLNHKENEDIFPELLCFIYPPPNFPVHFQILF